MSDLHAMIARWACPGQVAWIGMRSARRADMDVVERADVTRAGLSGDRARPGKRAVTLMQAEHLPAIASYLGLDHVASDQLRRNILVSGINLASLKGREVRVGTAILRLSVICAPCSRMEQAFGPGGYAAVRGHGGWCAEVIAPGAVCLGDSVAPID